MSRTSLRVALLNPCYWPEVRRGSERFARELADGLIERGHRPRLITSHRGLPSTTDEGGLEVVRVWRPPDGRLRRRVYEDHLTHVPFAYAALRRGSDDDRPRPLPDRRSGGRPLGSSEQGGRSSSPTWESPTGRAWRARGGGSRSSSRVIAGSDAVVALSRHSADGLRAVARRQRRG